MPQYNIDKDTREQIAEWLVRTGGEEFDFLEVYDGELEVAIQRDYYGEPPNEDLPEPTPDDREYITRLVSLAKVTVHLPSDEQVQAALNPTPPPKPKEYVTRLGGEQLHTVAKEWEQMTGAPVASWPNVQSFVHNRHPEWIDSGGLDMSTVHAIQTMLGYEGDR